MIQAPIALALVRKSDGEILTLQGLMKVDLPGIHLRAGEDAKRALIDRLGVLGVYASVPRLLLRWSAVAAWMGGQRPVSIYEALGWSGTPSDDCGWSTEEEVCRGQRQELYRRFFERLRASLAKVDEGADIHELPLARPKPPSCPRCGSSLRLRNRAPGVEARFDCGGCASSYALRAGILQRIPAL